MHDSANETLDSSLRNLVGKFYPQISLSIIYQDKNSVAIFFSTLSIKYLNVFGATLYINIHVRIVMRLMSVNPHDIFIHVSPSTWVYLQELIGLMQKLLTVISTNIFSIQTTL